ncbi:MAG: hypothetical protein JSS76_09645 [Bacteroidetes bacterium]|nr:hypothetical protein [Bacteroidota bacterium]
MARTGSNDLFRLIHCLTPEEKGYFTKFAKRHTEKGTASLQLFHAINKQKVFEEISLKKQFKAYAVMKVQLFDMILGSMTVFDSDSGPTAELMKQWIYVSYLHKKGLTEKAAHLNRQALQKAHDSELFGMEIEFLRLRHILEKHTWSVTERGEKNRSFFEAISAAQDKQREKDMYFELYQKLQETDNTKVFTNEFDTTFDEKLPLHLLKDGTRTRSISAEKIRFAARLQYHNIKQNREEQYKAAKEFYQYEKRLWQSGHPLANYYDRVKSIRGLILANLNAKKAEKVFALNEEMRKITSTHALQNAENEFCYFTYTQYAYWGSYRHKEGERFTAAEFPHRLIDQYGDRFHLFILEMYRFQLIFHFSNRNYKKVFISIAEFEARRLKKDAQFFYKSCELMRILLQIELKQYQLLPALVSNAIKHLDLTPAEKKILQALKKLNDTNHRQILIALQKDLALNKEKILLFNLVSIDTWLTSLLSHRSIAEIIKSNENERKP